MQPRSNAQRRQSTTEGAATWLRACRKRSRLCAVVYLVAMAPVLLVGLPLVLALLCATYVKRSTTPAARRAEGTARAA